MTIHTLITVIGNPRSGTKAKSVEEKYFESEYEFPGGKKVRKSFFGAALLEHLEATTKINVSKVIVLGTKGSHWQLAIEDFCIELSPEIKFAIYENKEEESITQTTLDKLNEIPTKDGRPKFIFCLIPEAIKPSEQIECLNLISDLTEKNTSFILDLTHGYRHLPQLIYQSCKVICSQKECSMGGVYYGKINLTDPSPLKQGHAIDLSGLTSLSDIEQGALSWKKSGNLLPLAQSLHQNPIREDLLKASHALSVNDFVTAQKRCCDALYKLSQDKNLEIATPKIIKDILVEIKNSFPISNESLFPGLVSFAEGLIERNDFTKACVVLFEGFLTNIIVKGNHKDPNNREHRETAKAELKSILRQFEERSQSNQVSPRLELFVSVRNILAHGSVWAGTDRNQKEAFELIGKKELLRNLLFRVCKCLALYMSRPL